MFISSISFRLFCDFCSFSSCLSDSLFSFACLSSFLPCLNYSSCLPSCFVSFSSSLANQSCNSFISLSQAFYNSWSSLFCASSLLLFSPFSSLFNSLKNFMWFLFGFNGHFIQAVFTQSIDLLLYSHSLYQHLFAFFHNSLPSFCLALFDISFTTGILNILSLFNPTNILFDSLSHSLFAASFMPSLCRLACNLFADFFCFDISFRSCLFVQSSTSLLHFSNFYLCLFSSYLILSLYSTISLYVYSFDVIHSFGYHAFGFKSDAIVGRVNLVSSLSLFFNGYFISYCYELCGLAHTSMLSSIIVLSFSSYYSALKVV